MEKIKQLSNEDLIKAIEDNNQRMQVIINETADMIEPPKEEIEKIFLENTKYCRLLMERGIRVPGKSFMMVVASMLGYPEDNTLIFKNRKKLTKRR